VAECVPFGGGDSLHFQGSQVREERLHELARSSSGLMVSGEVTWGHGVSMFSETISCALTSVVEQGSSGLLNNGAILRDMGGEYRWCEWRAQDMTREIWTVFGLPNTLATLETR
jgi:hypothetical protein